MSSFIIWERQTSFKKEDLTSASYENLQLKYFRVYFDTEMDFIKILNMNLNSRQILGNHLTFLQWNILWKLFFLYSKFSELFAIFISAQMSRDKSEMR